MPWPTGPRLFSDPVSHVSICLSHFSLSYCAQSSLLFPSSLQNAPPVVESAFNKQGIESPWFFHPLFLGIGLQNTDEMDSVNIFKC